MNRDIVLILTSFFVTSVFLNLVTRSSEDADKATPKVIAFSHKRKFTANFDEIIDQIESETLQTAPFIAEHLVPPFYNYWSVYVTSPPFNFHHQLSTCLVEKTMTTLRSAIMCFLSFHDEFVDRNRTISTESHSTRYCYKDNTFYNFPDAQASTKGNQTMFSLVRHPIDRFLSGYVNKCIMEAPKDHRCYGCNENLNCFVERLYETLWEAYNSKMTEYDFDLAHFAPQTWYCQYRTNLNNYVLVDYSTETEELVRQLDLVYGRAGVPQSYRVVISSEIRRQRSNNSTSQTSDRASVERHPLIDEKTYRRLVQIYYYDFVVFGYSLPTFL
ncbi:hypothetical protein NECAME_05223 [Necator americanus]|uniref:Uncharacterized protein n=1 Tax=Necator americanus TaxID=51031 RepID=W2SIU1_NECAM|nr:hypothetical protein NECAME_05223 [Necator americanus]ETN69510.1 hypothetical protein NECAME_05223 [Necator americanus]